MKVNLTKIQESLARPVGELSSEVAKEFTNEFLSEASQFQLGGLPTESSHPLTQGLSQLTQNDLPAAISLFKEVEIQALENLLNSTQAIEDLSSAMLSCLKSKGRIFFCGCGATGRLSISLECNWRESLAPSSEFSESVIGFIAGGDYALVKSIENFEDHPEHGARQLLELGFGENDLLVSCTEGGETPFVIGASLKAAQISKRNSYFLFCNTKKSLANIERSVEIFQHPKIHSHSLFTGPQAICGSTRLQASSNLYFACGIALFSAQQKLLHQPTRPVEVQLTDYIQFLKSIDLSSLQALIQVELNAYAKKEFLTYHVQANAISILTDLTERSPTFNLLAVENKLEQQGAAATANLCIDQAQSATDAWFEILKRKPRALQWPELNSKFDQNVMLGFDFSQSPQKYRDSLIQEKPQTHIQMLIQNQLVEFKDLTQNKSLFSLKVPTDILEQNLFLKLIFNLTSTLTQCLNKRVLGNMMLFVKPSNKKLIDRSARFVSQILQNQYHIQASYDKAVECVFEASQDLHPEESVVLKSVQLYLSNKHKNQEIIK